MCRVRSLIQALAAGRSLCHFNSLQRHFASFWTRTSFPQKSPLSIILCLLLGCASLKLRQPLERTKELEMEMAFIRARFSNFSGHPGALGSLLGRLGGLLGQLGALLGRLGAL